MSSLFLLSFISVYLLFFFFFFNDTATTEIYTLSLHDALPIFHDLADLEIDRDAAQRVGLLATQPALGRQRSEEHTSELQSQSNLVCRLLLEKKKKNRNSTTMQEPREARCHRIGVPYA